MTNGQLLDGTLEWQMTDERANRLVFVPSPALEDMARQFGIDINLPRYHLAHHQTRVQTSYYADDFAQQKAAEMKARSYKDEFFRKYGLMPDAVTLTVPMTAP